MTAEERKAQHVAALRAEETTLSAMITALASNPSDGELVVFTNQLAIKGERLAAVQALLAILDPV